MSGVWKDLTDNVNSMAGNLTGQVRNIAEVATAIAQRRPVAQDHGGRAGRDPAAQGDHQHDGRPAERVRGRSDARGARGRHRRQARRPGRRARTSSGVWKDLTDNVNSMASNLTGQVRNIAEVATAIARGDLSRKITVDVRGEILQLKETINTMVDQLNSFAAEVTRVAREVGTEGKLGGQAIVPGVAGTWKDLTDNVNSMAEQPDRPGAQHRRGGDRHRARRPVAQDHGRREGRDPAAEGNHQHDGRPAERLRGRSDARGARGRHRRQARRPGGGAGRRRHLEGPDRQRQRRWRPTSPTRCAAS